MRSILLFIAFVCFCSTSSFAQNSENFIELKNGTILQANDQTLTESESFRKGVYLKLGETKYPITDIKSYQLKGQFFSNFNDKMFVKRMISGKINLYEYVDNYTNRGQIISRVSLYLQKGDNAIITKFKSAKLRAMLEGNKEAMFEYRKFEKRRKKVGFYGLIGLTSMFAGFITLASQDIFDDDPSINGLAVVGAGVGTAGLVSIYVALDMKKNGEQYLLNTIKTYNKY